LHHTLVMVAASFPGALRARSPGATMRGRARPIPKVATGGCDHAPDKHSMIMFVP